MEVTGDRDTIVVKLVTEIRVGSATTLHSTETMRYTEIGILEASLHDDFQPTQEIYANFPHFDSYVSYAEAIRRRIT